MTTGMPTDSSSTLPHAAVAAQPRTPVSRTAGIGVVSWTVGEKRAPRRSQRSPPSSASASSSTSSASTVAAGRSNCPRQTL